MKTMKKDGTQRKKRTPDNTLELFPELAKKMARH